MEAGEVTIVALSRPAPELIVKFALSSSETGQRFGAGHLTEGWSDRTRELLRDLLASVEADVAQVVFEGDGTTTSGVVGEGADSAAAVVGF